MTIRPGLDRVAAFAALAVVVLLAFWPGLGGGFIFDDYPNIVQNERVHATSLDVEQMRRAIGVYAGLGGRPIATVSFAVNHALGALDPFGYKLGNLLIHLLNAILVFALLSRVLPLAGNGRLAPSYAAFVLALLWAIHPLQVSTVLYVVQRMEMLSLTFVLLALLAYMAGRSRQIDGRRGWSWLAACVPLVLLGLLCKETAILFPVYALALELTVLRFAAAAPASRRMLKVAYALGILVAGTAFFAVAVPHYASSDVYAVRDFTLVERLLTQLRVLDMYLGWIVLPRPGAFVFYYDNYVVSKSLLSPTSTLVSGLILLSIAFLAVRFRRAVPLFSLGIAWFFAAHLLTSNVVHLELVFEHRNYFAILGVLLAIAGLLEKLPAPELPRIRAAAVWIVVVGALALTLIRAATWGDPLLLALQLAEANPGSARASTDLGEQYMLRADADPQSEYYAMAVAEFERGSLLPDSSPMPEQGLIVLAASAGVPAKKEWWDRLVHKLETRAIGPQELTMITRMMEWRNNDELQLDDRRFADAYLVLANRMSMPPTEYYVYGRHALERLDDQALAQGLFARAADHSGEHPDFVALMVEDLLGDGFDAQARALADHASRIGLVDIKFPPSQPAPRPAPAPSADEVAE